VETDPPDTAAARRIRLLVIAGGAVGTGVRYAAFRVWYHVPGTFPTTTLVVNTLGAVALGALATMIGPCRYAREWRAFALVGVLGGFTTFSAYTVELALYVRADSIDIGAIYAATMTAFGVVAAMIGLRIGRMALVQRESRG